MLLIKNGYIKTMAGADIENGCLLLGDDGKIAAVGETIDCPEAQVIDAEGRLVAPGFVEPHSHIGLREAAALWTGIDHNEKTDPLTPQMRGIDAVNPMDEYFADAVRGGVTTVCTGPGSANVIGGTFAAIKTVGRRVDDMIVKNPVAMKCAFGENPKNAYGQSAKKAPLTRMGIAALLREMLFKARDYQEAKDSGQNPKFDMKLEAMLPVMRKEIPLKVHAHRADDILTAIRIAKEFDLKLTLDHCTSGGEIADILGMEGYPVALGPSFGSKSKPELQNKTYATAAKLHESGVKVSILTDCPVLPQDSLAMCAGLAVSAGLPMEAGWKAITINAAEHIGVADRVGSLEVGKDADVVLWNADPLTTLGAKAYMTIVDGKIVYREA